MEYKWKGIDLYSEENKKKISRIIQIELKITEAIRNGHQSYWGDQFRDERNEMLRLRKEILEEK